MSFNKCIDQCIDCFPYELNIAKSNDSGFSFSALQLISNYLTNRKQNTMINNLYSSWEDILFEVPQGSIPGQILFNIFLSDLFLIIDGIDFASYGNDNTIYGAGDSIDDIFCHCDTLLRKFSSGFLNQVKGKTDKFHLVLSKNDEIQLEVGESLIKNSTSKKFLDVKIGNKLSFVEHVKNIRKRHCVKSVRIRNCCGSYFPAFGLNNSVYFLRSEYK